MIHQLGPPTFFLTFISAESRWTALMSSLHMLNKKYMDIPKNLHISLFEINALLAQFLMREMKDIRRNAYAIKVAPLWEANTNTQFILDLGTSCLTKIDKSITNEFKP